MSYTTSSRPIKPHSPDGQNTFQPCLQDQGSDFIRDGVSVPLSRELPQRQQLGVAQGEFGHVRKDSRVRDRENGVLLPNTTMHELWCYNELKYLNQPTKKSSLQIRKAHTT